MRTDSWRFFTALCLLTLFMGSKGLELHVLSHDMEGERVSCEWCDHILVSQDSPIEPTDILSLDSIASHVDWSQNVSFSGPDVGTFLISEKLFGRPPPGL